MTEIYSFHSDLKLARRRRLDENRLNEVIKLLLSGEPLPANLHNHILSGDYKGYWECHITPDWLLLDEVATASGFSVRRTFSRLFKEKFGLTPTEYRAVYLSGIDAND